MLTNIYRIGGLHQVSWFQLVPDAESIPPTTSRKDAGSQDLASIAVVAAHMRLQEDGHLSCWTVPAQKEGANTRTIVAEEKIKLWVFTPGIQETLDPSVHPLFAGLKVVGAGLWCSPGDEEEVTSAFCEALRNRVERSLKGLSYVRFGDVFVKCRRHGTLESRKVLPVCELIFMGSEDAVFVHVIVRRKRLRLLAPSDLHFSLANQHKKAFSTDSGLTVVVAPYGSSGCLTGCCPGDLVTQLQRSKLQAFNSSSLPFRAVASTTSGGRAVQSCYAEVWVGQVQAGARQRVPFGSSAGNTASSLGNLDSALDQARDCEDEGQAKAADVENLDGKVLIYPFEAVLAPVLPPIPARTYLRRCWLQEWAGTHWLEDSAIPGLNWCSKDCDTGKSKNLIVGANGGGLQNGSGSSSSTSGSGGSSIKSSSSRGSGSSTSGSSSSSESEVGTAEELDADADSLTSKAAGLASGTSSQRPAGTNNRNSAQNVDATVSNSGSKRNRGKATGLSEEPPNKTVKMSMSPSGDMSALLEGVGNSSSKKGGIGGELNMPGSLNMGGGTPRGAGSQAGTPWDWADDGMGLGLGMGMDMQTDADILAEFGDFGDFFEDDGLHFGEPPGTAESQALIFADFVEGVNTPGTMSLDGPDPMLLPILDFPALEGFGKQLSASGKELSAKSIKTESLHSGAPFSPLEAIPAVAIDPLSKAEAMMLFAPGYARVDLPPVKDEVAFSSTYVPESRNISQQQSFKDAYVYNATPPPNTNNGEVFNRKLEQVVDHQLRDDVSDSKLAAEAGGDLKSFSRQASNVHVTAMDSIDGDSMATSKMRGAPYTKRHEVGLDSNGQVRESQTSKPREYSGGSSFPNLDPRVFPPFKSASPVLATELDCALVQVSMLCAKDSVSPTPATGIPPSSGGIKPFAGVVKEELSQVQVDQLGRVSSKPPQAQKKKSLPSRIAGDADEDVQDGLRGAQVGVWRPVQAPKPQKVGHASVVSRIGSSAPDTGNPGLEGGMITGGALKPKQWQCIIDAIPLLAQQAAVASDIALDGESGDGPLGWLAFQERQRLRTSCGPGMSHTGCGGMFSIRHSLDNAGIEYVDPLAAEVSPATVANLLQSDFRIAITGAFGETNADGPLTSLDWCRCRPQGDMSASVAADSKEGTSSITSAGGDPIATSQGLAGSLGGMKGGAGLVEDLDQRRSSTGRTMENSSLSDHSRGDEAGTSDSDLQASSNSYGATIVALPTPALLVGYQDDWLKTSPSVLHMWEKAPLEPYAHPKPVSYYVVCLGLDSLMSAADDFFQQLSSVYESCRLGTHVPGTTAGPTTGLNSGSSKHSGPGFMVVDSPPHPIQLGSALGLTGDFMASMGSGWNLDDFRKALLRVYKTVPLSANPSNIQRDPEQSPCTVVYIVSPSSEPADVLQIILDASQCFGTTISEKDRKGASFNQQSMGVAAGEDPAISPVVGFSTPRLVLQVLPAEVVMKGGGTVASQLDMLKEVAFGVYSKARRIQRKIVVPETTPTILSSSRGGRSGTIQGGPTMTGMWKDCNTGRSSGMTGGVSSGLDSSSLRSPWDGGWQPTSRFGDSSLTDGSSLGGGGGGVGEPLQGSLEASRFLYEPLFILADPGYPDSNANHLPVRTVAKEALRSTTDEVTGNASGLTMSLPESGTNTGIEGLDAETTGAGHLNIADLHCCYTWTDDWQWLVSVWTDARGELLDIFVLPLFGSQRDLGFLNFFSQILQQGLQLLSMAVEAGSQQPRNIIISRLGGFTERECQEWYRAVMTVGGDESRKWPLHLWPGAASGNSSIQLQDMALHSDRTLGLASSSSRPPSPSPASSFSSRSKPLGGMPMNLPRRPGQGLGANQLPMDSKGAFQWVNSISLVSVRVEHCLQAVSISDMNPSSGLSQGGITSATWPVGSTGNASNTTGVTTVRTLANMGSSFMLVPTNSLRTLSPQAWQLPATPSAYASPLAQLLEGSPLAPPLASAFVVSPPTPSPMSEFVQQTIKEEWPSTLHVGLIALSGNSVSLDSSPASSKLSKDFSKDVFLEAHRTVQTVAAQVHALSWLSTSPTVLLRRSPLPFHCNVAQRLRRLLSHLDTAHTFPRLPNTPL